MRPFDRVAAWAARSPDELALRVGLGLAGAAAGYAGERLVMTRTLRPPQRDRGTKDITQVPGATHREIATHDGGTSHVVERGPEDGPVLLLLHGVCNSSVVWHNQLLDLSDRFRVVAVDHRGHGRSKSGSDGYGLGTLARDVTNVMEHLDLTDVVLVGHSMGGMTAMRLCIESPDLVTERVAGMVLVSATAGRLGPFTLPLVAQLITPITPISLRLAGRVPGGVVRTNDLSYLFVRLGFGPHPAPEVVEVVQALIATTAPDAMASSITSLLDFDVAEALDRVHLPTLVINGSHDRLTPPHMGEEIARHLPKSEFVVLDGVGHMAMLERQEEFDRLLVEFADKVLAGDTRQTGDVDRRPVAAGR